LGTVVLPFKDIQVIKTAQLLIDADLNNAISPGDTLQYTIQVQNVGPGLDIAKGGYTLLDNNLPAAVSYIPGTFKAADNSAGVMALTDDASGTPFPLDNLGFTSPGILQRRGGTHTYTFQVMVLDTAVAASPLVNSGVLKVPGMNDMPFSVSTPVIPKLQWNAAPPAPIVPQATGSCMNDVYKFYGRTGTLSCIAKQVFMESVQASQPAQCVAGKPIKLTLTAVVRLNGYDKYDPHWYVAKDGGDALGGSCALGFLDKKYALASSVVTQAATTNYRTGMCNHATTTTTTTTTTADTDECGDVTLSDTTGGVLTYNILVDTEVMCKDGDKNGKLDISVCYGWKEKATDTVCKVAEKIAANTLPEVYPGSPTTCFCANYEIPNVVVLDGGGKVYPCA
jgi:uncharacterized repeat protein (TIGR01451 family)